MTESVIYKDHYVQCKDYNVLAGFLTNASSGSLAFTFQNLIGPKQGRAAVAAVAATESYVDNDGVVHAGFDAIPAQEAIGEVDTWYCCIRVENSVEITFPDGITEADHDVGIKLLGVWA